jgi:hypothetical protein
MKQQRTTEWPLEAPLGARTGLRAKRRTVPHHAGIQFGFAGTGLGFAAARLVNRR